MIRGILQTIIIAAIAMAAADRWTPAVVDRREVAGP